MRVRRLLLWLLGFGCLWVPVFDDPPLRTGAFVQDVTDRTACVAMITAEPVALTLTVHDALGRTVAELRDEPRRRHEFLVQGLAADTAHSYRLAGAGIEQSGRIRTAPAPGDDRRPVRFAALGDSGAVPWWVWLQRNALFHLPAAYEWLPAHGRVVRMGERLAAADPEFVLHLGDVVYPYGRQAHYAAGFFRPFAAVLASAPCYATLGNHDVKDDQGRQLLANLRLPANGVSGDERNYSFAWGAVRVFVADFNLADERDAVDAGHPSLRFLATELDKHAEPWFVVMSHFPIRSVSRQRDRPDLLQELLPLLQQHGVDLYLAGHDHTYQRFGDGRDDGVPMVVSGGGGKSLYDVVVGTRVVVAQSVYHWCSCEVVGRRFALRARSLDGDLIDTLELDKAMNPERVARIRARNPTRADRIEALVRG